MTTMFDGRSRRRAALGMLPLKHVTYRPGTLGDALLDRSENPGEAARAALARYLWLMRRAKQTVFLSRGEAQVLLTALRDYELNDTTLDFVWAKVDAAMRQLALDALHGVDREAFVARLRDLTPTQAAAMVDAAEIFWRTGADDEALARSGLVAA